MSWLRCMMCAISRASGSVNVNVLSMMFVLSLYKTRGVGYTGYRTRPGGCWRLLYLALVGVDTRAFSYAVAATVKRCTVWGLQESLYRQPYTALNALASKRLVVTALLRAT